MGNNDLTSKNINYILNNMPPNGILIDTKGNEVLTFTGFVEISPIGSVGFPVIYPETQQKNTLSVIDALSTLQGNMANKKLNI